MSETSIKPGLCPWLIFMGRHNFYVPEEPTCKVYRSIDGAHLYDEYDCVCRHCGFQERRRYKA